MARSFNQVVLMGNITRDPELRQTTGGQDVSQLSIALNRSYKDKDGEWTEQTDFVDVVIWGRIAQQSADHLHKGDKVLVSGRLQTRSYEKEGVKVSKTEVVATEVTFLDGANHDTTDQSA